MNRDEKLQQDLRNKTTLTATFTGEDNKEHELSLVMEPSIIARNERREIVRRTFVLAVCVIAGVKSEKITAKYEDEP